MALIVEDGSGLPNAESYQSVAGADTYHSKWGNTTWGALTTAQKEAALRKGTRYLDLMYHTRWKGARATSWLQLEAPTSTQALDWPRAGVVDADQIPIDWRFLPTKLVDAATEASLIASTGEDMMPDVEPEESAGVMAEELTAGPVTIKEQYGGAQSTMKKYTTVERLLADFLQEAGLAERG